MTAVRAFTDKENPNDNRNHRIFLPSYANLNETRISFKNAFYFECKDETGHAIRFSDNDVVTGIEIGRMYEGSFLNKRGEVMESGGFQVLQSGDLSSAFITTKTGGMDFIHEDKNYREKGQMILLKPDGSQEYFQSIDCLKGHGNTTWEQDKKSYEVILKRKSDLFGLGSAKKWLLMANCMDPSQIRNSIVYGMAEAVGLRGSARMRYLDLYLNGEYKGLYQLSEKVEIADNRLEISNLQYRNESENFILPYRAERISENGAGDSLRVGYDLENLPADITGGYLIEHDYGEKFEAEPSKFRTESGDKYVIRSPNFADIREVRYIADLFQDLENRSGDGSPMDDLIDLESFADKYILEEFVKNDGAGTTSSFFYKDSDSVDPLIYAGPAWDYDRALGQGGTVTQVSTTLNFCTNHIQNTEVFYNLYTRHPEFQSQVRKDFRDKFLPYIERLLNEGMIDGYFAEVQKDRDMDSVRWRKSPQDLVDQAEAIKVFIKERTAFLKRLWVDGETLRYVQMPDDNLNRHPTVGVLDGEPLVRLPGSKSRKGQENWHWEDSETGQIIEDHTPITKDMTLIAVDD